MKREYRRVLTVQTVLQKESQNYDYPRNITQEYVKIDVK